MRVSDFNDETVASALVAVSVDVSAVCVEHGGGRSTLFDWISRFGTMDTRGGGRVRRLEKENSDLRSAFRSFLRDFDLLREVLDSLVSTTSERRSLEIVGLSRTSLHYQLQPDRQEWLFPALMEVAEAHQEYGYRRLRTALRSSISKRGVEISLNHKTVLRICRDAGLSLPRRRPGDPVTGERHAPPCAKRANVVWAIDFMSARLWAGRRRGRSFRLLNMLDVGTRVGLAIEDDCSLPALRVVEALDRVELERGNPMAQLLDNGSEFDSGAVRRWAAEHGVTLCYSRLGASTDNPFIESFNGRCRNECLNRHDFRNLDEARGFFEAWRVAYSSEWPYSRLGNLPPAVYANALEETAREEADWKRGREKKTTVSARAADPPPGLRQKREHRPVTNASKLGGMSVESMERSIHAAPRPSESRMTWRDSDHIRETRASVEIESCPPGLHPRDGIPASGIRDTRGRSGRAAAGVDLA